MKTYTARIEGITPYSQSKYHAVDMLDKELHDAYEKRTWQHKMHVDEDGYVIIPPMAPKNCLSEAAKFLSIQIKGKGKATYTKHFEAGVMCMQPIELGIRATDVKYEALFVPADGRRGGDKRVLKYFPYIAPGWGGELELIVLDETITEEVLLQHLKAAGNLIGLGRFRPRKNGFYGRFLVHDLQQIENRGAA